MNGICQNISFACKISNNSFKITPMHFSAKYVWTMSTSCRDTVKDMFLKFFSKKARTFHFTFTFWIIFPHFAMNAIVDEMLVKRNVRSLVMGTKFSKPSSDMNFIKIIRLQICVISSVKNSQTGGICIDGSVKWPPYSLDNTPQDFRRKV